MINFTSLEELNIGFFFNTEDSNAIEDAGISHLVKMKGIKLKKIFLGKNDIN